MNTPVVSVIIPAYGVTRFIRHTLDSVLSQSFTDFEIIVVNDNCPDTTRLERELDPYYSKLVYLKHSQNSGLAATRNTGISIARGEFVAFLDGDDLWEPNYLAKQIAILRQNPEADVVYCDGVVFGDIPDAGKRLMELAPSTGAVTVSSLFRQKVQVIVSVLARRDVLLRVGLFDATLRSVEDFDLWVRIAKSGGKIIYHREQLIRYRRHAKSLSANSVFMLESALVVASKTLKRTDLTPDERLAVEEAAARWTGNLKLEQGKLYFSEGNHQAGSDLIFEANRYLQRWKLLVVGTLMRWAPRLLRIMHGLRR